MNRAPIADGQWHSFAAARTNVARVTMSTSFTRAGVASSHTAWHGNHYWGGHGWYGGYHHNWGWGWPGWNWGWGWGCCGWGWGIGFGWGWGWWGPGWAWGPFWAWPAYYYSPWLDSSWLYADDLPAPYVLDPYPA